ncbi:MAG: NADH-quinone oxidoreductase subunit L [Coriobacteriia bacterium]|nr:NADH-quinone oxidoreductase subunit L [Coriobacteriia bacterium]
MNWLIAIPALPALAFLALVALPRELRNKMLWLPVAGIVGSTVLSLAAFAEVWPGGEESLSAVWNYSWVLAEVGGRPFELGVQLDSIAAILLVVVTVVASCVQVYSLGYMHNDARRGWYFAVLSLFTAAMLALVLADNLLLLFATWEIMGLCSYLLIGFWYELEAPRKASQKAFLTTRVGDLGLLFALVVIYNAIGTWELTDVFASVETWGPGVATAAAIGLVIGAMGKSAQVPLHVWLPDAMAGPTPASALIHAATMVAAGVYLLTRMLPVLEAAPAVLSAVLVIGAVTGIVGGLLAAVQHDVKKVLAYSTISQLGLMFMAIGSASVVATMFHLVTHAFFKSLLFLGAGVIIHSAKTQDMREMGGLRKHMPITWATFLVGSLALAGVIPFSGFFSKDEIIASLLHEHLVWAVVAVLTVSLLTAFYMTRLYFRVFEGPEQIEHLHDGHKTMLFPMVLLALITCVVGFGSIQFAAFLGEEIEWPSIELILMSSGVAAAGISSAWWVYGRRSTVVNTRVYKERMGRVYSALSLKLYFDIAYDAIFIKPFMRLGDLLWGIDRSAIDGVVNGAAAAWVRLAEGSWGFDRVAIDGIVNGLASFSRNTGSALRSIQTGRLQTYQRLILAAVVLFMLYLVLKGA